MSEPANRRRIVAIALSVVAVVAVAVALGLVVGGNSSSSHPSGERPPKVVQPADDPRTAAIDTARTIIAKGPVLPRARKVDRAPLAALDGPADVPGAQHVQQTRFWTAPGTVDDAISYLNRHGPKGMPVSGSGTFSGPAGVKKQIVAFEAGEFASLQDSVVAYKGGVAVRADAQVMWAPRRSPADTVPASVTSVDVLIVRQDPQRNMNAKTVQRTLTGAAAHELAHYVDRLPLPVPTGPHSCPNMGVGERRVDQLVFRTAAVQTAQLRVNLVGCASATFTTSHREPIQLDLSYPGARDNLDQRILAALGLPSDYGG